jgi:hypothetical protein
MWSNVLKKFHTLFNCLNQDPTIEFQEHKNIIQFIQFALGVAMLKCYFIKHGQGILGVKKLKI